LAYRRNYAYNTERAECEAPANCIYFKTAVSGDAEYTLLVGLCLKEENLWAPKGYRLADEQFILNRRAPLQSISAKGKIKVKGNKVVGKDFSVEFDGNGVLKSYIYRGTELLAAPPEYNDFRRIYNDTEGKQIIGIITVVYG
jgi:beta-galactosidase